MKMNDGMLWPRLLLVPLALQALAAVACADEVPPRHGRDQVLVQLPEAQIQDRGLTRVEWNYTFLRGNYLDRVFDASQFSGTRSNHRKTHLVTWRIKHGLTDRLQPEAEIVYKAFRQHTHTDGDEHDRNDDGDFERLFAGLSYQAVRESSGLPDLRVRGGVLIPRRAETEGIGQETGFDVIGAVSKQLGAVRCAGSLGFAMTFGNHDHPADPIFTSTPISKGHDLRTLVYGVGVTRPFLQRWQANLEVDGRVFDTIQLNKRVHRSAIAVTPGIIYTRTRDQWDSWIGVGFPIGVTHDTDRLGVSVRTGARF